MPAGPRQEGMQETRHGSRARARRRRGSVEAGLMETGRPGHTSARPTMYGKHRSKPMQHLKSFPVTYREGEGEGGAMGFFP